MSPEHSRYSINSSYPHPGHSLSPGFSAESALWFLRHGSDSLAGVNTLRVVCVRCSSQYPYRMDLAQKEGPEKLQALAMKTTLGYPAG
jgi:hypothetical protein